MAKERERERKQERERDREREREREMHRESTGERDLAVHLVHHWCHVGCVLSTRPMQPTALWNPTKWTGADLHHNVRLNRRTANAEAKDRQYCGFISWL